MIVVVDTNILFSACITPNSIIAKILLDDSQKIRRISCYLLFIELFKYQTRIIDLAKQPIDKIALLLHDFLREIEFFSENIIEQQYWEEADRLTRGVDSDDISFVALALKTGGWLWTGDKKLTNHLKAMGFDRVLNTSDLYDRLQIN